MSNARHSSSVTVAYDLKVRNALGRSIASMARDLPAPPAEWRRWGEAVVAAVAGEEPVSGERGTLYQLREALFAAPGGEAAMVSLWREALATAVFACAFATLRGLDAGGTAVAGVLHRAGEAGARRALALAESASGIELDARARLQLCALHAQAFADELIRSWPLPPEVAVAINGWRRFGQFGAVSACAAVYLAHLLAEELLNPDSLAPGVVEGAAAELGLDEAEIATLRAFAPAAQRLLQRVG
jgi:hypothetical protein